MTDQFQVREYSHTISDVSSEPRRDVSGAQTYDDGRCGHRLNLEQRKQLLVYVPANIEAKDVSA